MTIFKTILIAKRGDQRQRRAAVHLNNLTRKIYAEGFSATSTAMVLAAAYARGTLATTSFSARGTSRAAMNTSPEPFTSVGVSLLEDGRVPFGLWLAKPHPFVFVGPLALRINVWLKRICWRFMCQLYSRVTKIFSGKPDTGTRSTFSLKSLWTKSGPHA